MTLPLRSEPIHVAIVDDEPLARERIRTLLEKEPGFVVQDECATGVEALATFRRRRPELVFLDIQMPEMTGFELLERLEPPLPGVIFVTAFDQHALKAFEVHALDYLLKPFKQARFRETLHRAREALSRQQEQGISSRILEMLAERRTPAPFLTRVPVKIEDRTVFLKVELIDWIEAAGNYLVLHSGKESHILRETLTSMESKLDPAHFLRISRSSLINLGRVKELQPLFGGEHAVVLDGGKTLTMTRSLREVEDRLKFS